MPNGSSKWLLLHLHWLFFIGAIATIGYFGIEMIVFKKAALFDAIITIAISSAVLIYLYPVFKKHSTEIRQTA